MAKGRFKESHFKLKNKQSSKLSNWRINVVKQRVRVHFLRPRISTQQKGLSSSMKVPTVPTKPTQPSKRFKVIKEPSSRLFARLKFHLYSLFPQTTRRNELLKKNNENVIWNALSRIFGVALSKRLFRCRRQFEIKIPLKTIFPYLNVKFKVWNQKWSLRVCGKHYVTFFLLQ